MSDDDDFIGNKDGLKLLNYESDVLTKTLPASTLFLVASGLGVERLFLEHLILLSDRRLLTIVLNTNPHDESYFISKLKEHNLECGPKVINSEVSIKDRQSIYLEGGVQFCSSRVILVDLLQNRIPVSQVAAILVYRAHQTLNSFQDSFILRLYREKKPGGMVKAFSDCPMAISGLGQLQRLVDRVYVRHVELMPRFSVPIEEELSKYQIRSSIFSVDVTPPMRRIHRTLIDFIKVCIRDLRSCSSIGKQNSDEHEEMIHVPWAPTQLEKRLKNRRGFLSEKQTRLLNDVSTLREILQASENLDAATLYARLNFLKNDRNVLEEQSGWLISPSFSRIMEDLNTICGESNGKCDFKKYQIPAKWSILKDVLGEIKHIGIISKNYTNDHPCVLVVTNTEDLSRQVTDVIKYGTNKTKWMTWRQLERHRQEIPEDEPMWAPECISQLLRSHLEGEPKNELIANVQKSQKTVARAAQKRRKVAEELASSSTDSRIQTSIVQFGILQYKKRRTESPQQKSFRNEEHVVKQEIEEERESDSLSDIKILGDFENAELLIFTSNDTERYTMLKLLEKKKPIAIVLYTMSLQILRQIEVFRSCNPEHSIHVFFLQYRESTEENRYLESINRETMAFESLIREQGSLMISREFNVEREDAPRIQKSSRDGGGSLYQRREIEDPRDQESTDTERPKIIVDMREFNSELPTVLYIKGYDVVAATLEIGDYILSPDIAVERKALDDLAQSLQSGRVFKQIEQMLEYYPCTVLMIESNQKFETKIVNGGPFQGELSRHCREIRSKLCALIRAYPRVKCIWTLSPANSAEIFIELKISAAEPDIEKAVSLKTDKIEDIQEEKSGNKSKKEKKKKANLTILRALTTHLEMKNSDAQNMLINSEISNLTELFSSSLSTESLQSFLSNDQISTISRLTTYDFSKK